MSVGASAASTGAHFLGGLMASYNVIICNTVSPNQLKTNTCPTGTFGHIVTIDLPDGLSVYGLPNISAADVATISLGIAGVWAIAFLIKKMMSML